MYKRTFTLLCLLWVAACVGEAPPSAPSRLRWAAYYGNSLPAKAFAAYDLVVFDRRYHPALKKLPPHVTALAYVSMGEVHGDTPEHTHMQEAGAILFKQEKWNSYAVDLANRAWQQAVLAAVADAKKQGFAGVMLDTVDSPLHWANGQSPERARDMADAAVGLIAAIREANPDMKLMLNRGFAILTRVAPKLDMVLAESIFTQPDETAGQFSLVSPTSYQQAVIQLHKSASLAQRLQVFTLDYWNPDDVYGIKRIYAAQRASGFAPYVSTPDLRRLWPEPISSIHPRSIDAAHGS